MLDTNIFLFMMNDRGRLSKRVDNLISDWSNTLCISIESVREIITKQRDKDFNVLPAGAQACGESVASQVPCFPATNLYIVGMGKTNNSYKAATADKKDSKEYEKHTCGECANCTPVTAFHTLTVKDRQPTMGRCPEEKYCVLLSQQACKKFSTTKQPGSA